MAFAIVVFIVAFAPGLFWLWIVYNRDKFQPEPRGLVIRTFLLGILVALPIAIIEVILFPGEVDNGPAPVSLGTAIYLSFIVAGTTEEVGKYLIVRGTVYNSPHFDEPIDGIVYSSAALGFASIENVVYILEFGADVMLFRGPISTLAHAIFSSFWGYPLGLRKVMGRRSGFSVLLGLFLAITVHGFFNFFIYTGSEVTVPLLLISLFTIGVTAFILMIWHARRHSPFRR